MEWLGERASEREAKEKKESAFEITCASLLRHAFRLKREGEDARARTEKVAQSLSLSHPLLWIAKNFPGKGLRHGKRRRGKKADCKEDGKKGEESEKRILRRERALRPVLSVLTLH